MTNAEIAAVFARIELILDLKGGENPFRIRAYERAAIVIQNLPKDLHAVYEEGGIKALEDLPGVGEDLAQKIEEMLKTGSLQFLSNLEKKMPEGLLEIMEIEGLGPKKTKQLYTKFKVQSIKELTKLAKSGKIEKLPGWGKKSVENVLRGIEQRKLVKGRLPLPQAQGLAHEIIEALRKTKLCEKLEIAGSFRRCRENMGDLDFLATSREPGKVMD
ncbi:MAG: helix-hairpin-helix domain-containing protein, partial [Patescibacteria group bacterium]